jgi:hypothetical protein
MIAKVQSIERSHNFHESANIAEYIKFPSLNC